LTANKITEDATKKMNKRLPLSGYTEAHSSFGFSNFSPKSLHLQIPGSDLALC